MKPLTDAELSGYVWPADTPGPDELATELVGRAGATGLRAAA